MANSPHRNNSDFQLRHFLAGGFYTPDVAWGVLYEQKLDMSIKLAHAQANLIRREARRLELQERQASATTEIEKLLVKADQHEFDANEGLLELSIEGATKEIATITTLMEELEPLRKYGHLPMLDACEAAQEEEWMLEFKRRIENYLLTNGTLPEDQLQAMRKHPQFSSELVPYIKNTIHAIAHSTGTDTLDLVSSKTLLQLDYKGENNDKSDHD